MDALTRRQFDRAMFAKDRTLAIRVGDYASRDIKEASFEYGYIKGDTYKPGGTCAGSSKITFTSIITTFNKLDILHPEIGLLVGNTYQWVKMGEYFINDIEIDRNRNTTTLELMDGMFKLNREYVTDLHFPAEVREVIQEICLKTGIELANDYFGISAMRYHVEQVPEGKKLSFRDMLSAMTQMIGMSCFFNREGKMEIRDLTESNITINADSYFLHGLTKSEIEYQIAGITCKTDKRPLTVGMKTGRSLELDNVFMTQSALNDLYYKLKNLTYYPYNLNYQGHLLLEVGQWVTIQTNKEETFKVPVLSQSFTFKGGLRGRISADSKAGNDTQYSYEGTITKQIKQQDGFEAKIQAQIEAADKDFDQKVDKIKKDFNDQVELAKAKAEEVKQELSDTINQRFDSFDNGPLKEAKRKAEEALKNAGASSLLAQEAKQIGLDSIAKLEAFKSQTTSAQTALLGDLDALKRTIANDIRPKQAQAEAEIAKQVEALIQTKNELSGIKSAQATYEETTTRRLSELTNLANGKASKSELTQTAEELASKIASVRVGGRNYIRNGQFKNGSKNWLEYQSVDFGLNFNYQHSLGNRNRPGVHFFHDSQNIANFFGLQQTFSFDGVRGEKVSVSLLVSKDGGDSNSGLRVALHYIKNKNIIGQEWQNIPSPQITSKYKRFTFTFTLSDDVENLNLMLFGEKEKTINLYVTDVQLERGSVATDYKEAPEDTDGQISAVESTFKQRADSLDAGVRSLTEDLRTKADISALNVTAENIRQSVKSLETDTQNKLNQKLSQAEFEVQAGSIRQEILNATKDKADKTLVVAEAGKLREEFSKMKVGSRNYAEDYDFSRGLWYYTQGDNSPQDWTISNGEYNVKGTTNTWKQMQIYSKEGSRASGKSSTALLDLEIGETYTLSFQGICYSGSSSVWLSLRANRTAPSNPEIMYGNFNLTSSWQTYQVTIPALTKPDKFDLWRIILGYNEIGHVAFRKVELTRSSTRIDAGPAPEDGKTDLVVAKSEFQRTAEGLSAKLAAVESYVGQDGQRQEALQHYTREESAKQATAVRELVAKDYVGKTTYQETVRAIENKFEAITNPQNGSIATQIAKYKTAVDGRFADITSMISGKANQTDFQRVKETSQLYERILGNTENGIADKVARMAMTNQLFQVEVAKAAKGGRNYIRNGQFKNGSKNWLEYQSVDFGLNFNYQHSLGNRNRPGVHFFHDSQNIANFFGLQQTFSFDGVRGEKVSVSLLVSKDGGDSNSGLRVALHYIKNKNIIGQEWQNIPSPQITSKYKRFTFTFTLSDDVENLNLMLFGEKEKTINLYVTDVQLERGSVATDYKEAPEDTDEAVRSVQSQLAGSWSVQNLTSAGSIVSQINATNNQILFEAEKIRFKGKTLADQLTAIDGYFKRLFVGEGNFATLNTEVLKSDSITADKLVMDMAMARRFVSSDIFTNTLASKTAFINQLQSVIVSSTLLEGYKGWIGGFQIGTHDSGSGRWLTGRNHFSVGMGDGEGGSGQTALWVNWGSNWSEPGYYAWFVKNNGSMYCYNTAEFWRTPIIHGDLKVTGRIRYDGGVWIYSGEYEKIGRSSKDYFYLEKASGARDWFPAWNDTSDRRLKSNIQESSVSGVDVINRLKTYSYRKEFNNEVEDIKCGIMAQDVQKYAPDAFREGPDGIYTYNTFALVPYLIKAIQELNQKIEKMEKTIA